MLPPAFAGELFGAGQPLDASRYYVIVPDTPGHDQALYKAAPTREKADQLIDQRLAAPFPADANDVRYQWDYSRDCNPSAGLEKIKATVLAIEAAPARAQGRTCASRTACRVGRRQPAPRPRAARPTREERPARAGNLYAPERATPRR
jgi:hypothetical protein